MLQSEVINKLARECCLAIGEFDHFKTIHTYIQMALAVGIEHFRADMEEIVALDQWGKEAGRFKSILEAAHKLGIYQGGISDTLAGRQQSTGGYKFMKVKDYDLIPREDNNKSKLQIIPLK